VCFSASLAAFALVFASRKQKVPGSSDYIFNWKRDFVTTPRCNELAKMWPRHCKDDLVTTQVLPFEINYARVYSNLRPKSKF
jgi:hypothetical protein